MSEFDLKLQSSISKSPSFKMNVKWGPVSIPTPVYDVIGMHQMFGEWVRPAMLDEPADKRWLEIPPFNRWTAILEE